MNENSNITKPLEDIEKAFKRLAPMLPRMAGNEVVNFTLDNFKRQGFLGNSFVRWPARKNPTKWGKSPKRNGRAVLVMTGRLRRATRVIQADWSIVKIGNDTPWARTHNEGMRLGFIQSVKSFERKVSIVTRVSSLKTKKTRKVKTAAGTTTVKAHSRRINQKIPARPFLGNSPYLSKQIQRTLASAISKALK